VVPGGPVNPPLVLSATYHQGGDTVYGRLENPVFDAFESALGGLEGGRALGFASGLAAVAAVLELLPVPGVVVVDAGAYSGTRQLLADLAGRGRLQVRQVDLADTDATLAACADLAEGQPPRSPAGAQVRTAGPDDAFGAHGLLWIESPSNPLLAVADAPALVAGAHGLGMDVAFDNTFATPLLQQPLEWGTDVVVHSATKALSGHSDVLLGATVTTRPDLHEALHLRRSLHGGVPGPVETWLVLRGMRTLALRVERSQANAGELAARLAGHPGVISVRYPGLASDPGHDRMRQLMRGPGFVVSFEVAGGADAAEAVARGVRVATAGTSLGGVETLIERRARVGGDEQLPPGLLRMSVGIEDVEDLWSDLDDAIRAAAGA
jgi:cystathionine gamma-synthase